MGGEVMKLLSAALTILLFCTAQMYAAQASSPYGDWTSQAIAAMKLDPGEFNALLIDSTFNLQNDQAAGTGFVLVYGTDSGPPAKPRYVLCTADHVLSLCSRDSDTVKIVYRRRSDSDPLKWDLEVREIKIAKGGRPLWVRHPTADIAVLPVEVPDGIIKRPLPAALLADKRILREFGPGRDVFVLGYPFGALVLSGFPIFRPAKITSRVIDDHGSFAATFAVFPGDSGGPVYWIERNAGGLSLMILGLVTSAMTARTDAPAPISIGVGYVEPATEVLETIQLLTKQEALRTSTYPQRLDGGPLKEVPARPPKL
jgi:Trypsin-like peptidase domain